MSIGLNDTLRRFQLGVEAKDENYRVTCRDGTVGIDTNDVGKLKRLFKFSSGAAQIQQNNEVRTMLLDALTSQFNGRQNIPASVLNALNGSSRTGKSDMQATDGVRVNTGHPLTVRRIRQVLAAVQRELNLTTGGQEGVELKDLQPPTTEDSETDQLKSNQESSGELENSSRTRQNVPPPAVDPATKMPWSGQTKDEQQINKFATEISEDERSEIAKEVLADTSLRAKTEVWKDVFCRRQLETLLNRVSGGTKEADDVLKSNFGIKDNELADLKSAAAWLKEDLACNDEVIGDAVRELGQYFCGGKKADSMSAVVKKTLLADLRKLAASSKDVMGFQKTVPKSFGVSQGVTNLSMLKGGAVFKQTSMNTCPILSTVNAMMLTGGRVTDRVKNAMLLRFDAEELDHYFEFPFEQGQKKKLRVYLREFAKVDAEGLNQGMFDKLSPFEKAAFLAMKKANLLGHNNAGASVQPGDMFEVSGVYRLFGLEEPKPKGALGGSKGMAKPQLFLLGKEVAEALAQNKVCVLRKPGHFMAISGVRFDEKTKLPTFACVDSTTLASDSTFSPVGQTDFQVYIGGEERPVETNQENQVDEFSSQNFGKYLNEPKTTN